MIRRFSYVTVKEAFKTISNSIDLHPLDSEIVPINEAYGRVLSENIVSQINIPPHDMSHFDGFAIKAVDTKYASVKNPIYLVVIDNLYPGQTPECEVHPGEAVYLTTGSYLPKGADSVVAVEATKMVNSNQIEIRSKVDPGEHVILCGSDIEKDQILFRKGHKLRAQDLSVLATLRTRKIEVVKKPVVAFICVGDELTDDIDEIEAGKIVNSLRHMVYVMIQESGGVPIYLGIASDQVAEIKEKIEEGVSKADIVLLIGGSSMGKKDVTSEALDSMGKPGVIIHGIKRKPGRVSGFAVVRDKPIVLLPGLCHSLVVGFHTFVFPLILIMSRLSLANAQLVLRAKITHDISFTSFVPFEQVTFVNVKRTQEGYIADPYVGVSSSFSILGFANAFIITPPRKTMVKAGEEVEVHLLPSFFYLNDIFKTIS